jgi:sugar phosphate isomerase/epimerase
MRISMWSNYLTGISPEEMVEIMLGSGWNCTELSDEHAKVLLKRANAAKAGKEFKVFCDDHGFSILQGHLFLTLNIAPPDPVQRIAAIDELKRWFELFSVLGIKAGVLHPGGADWPEGTEPERIKEARMSSMETINSCVDGTPLAVCLENMPRCFIGHSADELLEMIAPFSTDNFGICLDTGHLNLVQGDPVEFIRTAGDNLKALHIADNMGVKDDHILPYSGGTVPWEEVLTALREINYQGLFNFEVPGEKRPEPIRLDKLDYARKLALWMIRDL